MPKENGFASFTPKQSKEFMKEQEKQPQDSFAGVQRHKNKQRSVNRHS